MRTPILMLASALIVATACGSSNDTVVTPPVSKIVNLTATLSPANEPPTLVGNPTGSGTFTATLDTSTNVFSWNVTFTGLTSNVNNGHIHGPFPDAAKTTAGVILNFNPTVTAGATFTGLNSATSGTATGTVILNSTLVFSTTINGDSLRKLLLAGAVYANIHTISNPGGEIRGQITKK